MQKQFKISGMSCGHCRRAVENALNSIDGVNAVVTLDPPIAEIEFGGGEKTTGELQEVLAQAGEYGIEER